VDFSRLNKTEWLGLGSSVVLIASLFLPWFGLTDVPEREIQGAWVCGVDQLTCTPWDTYPMARWLFVAAAVAPVLLAYFILTDEMGKYPTGEFTMTVGFAVIVLVGFHGAVVQPGEGLMFGLSLEWGYFLALLAGVMMAVAGAMRSLESDGGAKRKPPATF